MYGLLNKDNDIYFTIVGREASINKDSYLQHPWISGKRGNVSSSIRRYYKERQTHSGSPSAFPLIESPIDANSRRFDQYDASNQRLNRPVTRQVSSLGTCAKIYDDYGPRKQIEIPLHLNVNARNLYSNCIETPRTLSRFS